MDEIRFFEAVRQSAAQEAMALSGAYLLHGEEEYSKEQAVRQAAALPAEAARALNVQRLDAPAAADVQAACETLPFFDRCRVVIVRDLPAPEEAALAAYAPAVPETALLLVVQRGAAAKTSPLFKALAPERAVEFPRCDEARAAAFLKKRAASRGVSLPPAAARRLIAMVGTDLAALESALFLTADYVGPGGAVTEEALARCVTPDVEYRVFDLLALLLAGDRRRGYAMLHGMLQSGESALGLASFLEGRVRQMLSARQLLASGMTEAAGGQGARRQPVCGEKDRAGRAPRRRCMAAPRGAGLCGRGRAGQAGPAARARRAAAGRIPDVLRGAPRACFSTTSERRNDMLKYIVLFKFRDPEECLPTVIEKLHSMEGVIPEILSMETGADIWHNGARSYDLALTCTFRDMDAVAVYDRHPYHEKMREYIYAHRVDGKTVIYEVPDGE